jgi:hypothetical protein
VASQQKFQESSPSSNLSLPSTLHAHIIAGHNNGQRTRPKVVFVQGDRAENASLRVIPTVRATALARSPSRSFTPGTLEDEVAGMLCEPENRREIDELLRKLRAELHECFRR